MDLSKLRAEEKAAEEALYGKQEQVENPETKESTAPAPETQEPVDQTIVHQLESVVPEQTVVEKEDAPKRERVSWKNRYATYKASTDRTIHELRLENAGFNEKVLSLEKAISDMKLEKANLEKNLMQLENKASEKPLFTQEDEDILGPEAIAIMSRAMAAKEGSSPDEGRVATLEAELQAIKNERLADAKKKKEDLVSTSMDRLKAKLTEFLPEWSELDVDPRFKDFIEGIDPISGSARSTLFQRAMRDYDVGRVLSFYVDFKELISPGQKEDILESMITPTGSNVSNSNPDANRKKNYSMREYREFMTDLSKGRWKGRESEAKKIERTYDIALLEGRMIE